MTDPLAALGAEPRSLTEELFARPGELKIFVSSKMSGGVYLGERKSCVGAVEGTGMAKAWFWERDANAGPFCSESVCLGHAATADGLILILGDELTPITRREFEVATERGIATFVFIDERETQNADALAFVRALQKRVVTKNFHNIAELETHVVAALHHFAVQSWRRTTHSTWQAARTGGRR
jgi:hypothetical protein